MNGKLEELNSPNSYELSSFFDISKEELTSRIYDSIGIFGSKNDYEIKYFSDVFERLSYNQLFKIFLDIEEYKKIILPAISNNPRDPVNKVFIDIIKKYARERVLNEKLFCTSRFGDLPNKEYVKGLFFDHINGHNETPSDFIKKMNSVARISGDLNGLKAINDLISHEAGDKYLNSFVVSFKKAIDIVSKNKRYENLEIIGTSEGGDEFCIMIKSENGLEIKEDFVNEIQEEIQKLIETDKELIKLISDEFDFSKKPVLEDLFGKKLIEEYYNYNSNPENKYKDVFETIKMFAEGKFKLPVKIAFGGERLGDYIKGCFVRFDNYKNKLNSGDVGDATMKINNICDRMQSGEYVLTIEDISVLVGGYFDDCDKIMFNFKKTGKEKLKESNDVFDSGLRLVYSRNEDQKELQMIVDNLEKIGEKGNFAYRCPNCKISLS